MLLIWMTIYYYYYYYYYYYLWRFDALDSDVGQINEVTYAGPS